MKKKGTTSKIPKNGVGNQGNQEKEKEKEIVKNHQTEVEKMNFSGLNRKNQWRPKGNVNTVKEKFAGNHFQILGDIWTEDLQVTGTWPEEKAIQKQNTEKRTKL